MNSYLDLLLNPAASEAAGAVLGTLRSIATEAIQGDWFNGSSTGDHSFGSSTGDWFNGSSTGDHFFGSTYP